LAVAHWLLAQTSTGAWALKGRAKG
jgi:hypothetical protein